VSDRASRVGLKYRVFKGICPMCTVLGLDEEAGVPVDPYKSCSIPAQNQTMGVTRESLVRTSYPYLTLMRLALEGFTSQLSIVRIIEPA
jgi:hypothetical protein